MKYIKTSWCVLRSSEKLRSAIEYKIKQRDLTNKKLSEISDIPTSKIIKYRNKYPYHMSQGELIRLCLALGIEVDLRIEFVD